MQTKTGVQDAYSSTSYEPDHRLRAGIDHPTPSCSSALSYCGASSVPVPTIRAFDPERWKLLNAISLRLSKSPVRLLPLTFVINCALTGRR